MDAFGAWLKTELKDRIWHSYGSTILGLASAMALEAAHDLTGYLNALPAVWAHLAAAALLILLAGWKSDRAVAKASAAKLAAVGVLLFGFLFATPAYAGGWGVLCVAGCPQKAEKMKLSAGDIPVDGDQVWIGPSVAAQIFQRDAQKNWSISATPTLSWGIFWKPSAWTTSASLLSFNAGLGLTGTQVFSSGASTFDINLIPTIGIANILQIGYGPSFHLATSPAQKDGVTGTLFLGIGTSIGGP